MQIGTNISSANFPLPPGIIAGYNGTDFDPVRSTPDNLDNIALVTGGQGGAVLRVLAEAVGYNGSGWDRLRSLADNSDGVAPSASGGILRVFSEQGLYNGSAFDRQRSNQDGITLANKSNDTTTPDNSGDQINYNGRGVKVFVNVTAISGTGASITLTIQGKDPLSGQYFNMLTGTAITAVGTQLLTLYPALTAAANSVANDILPRTWRLYWTLATNTNITFTAGGIVLL